MDRWRASLLVVCVLAAGCSAAPDAWSSTDPSPTITPAPLPETPAVSAATVPGVSPDGSINATRLANAHARATTGRTYTWVFSRTRTGPEADAQLINATRRVRVGPEATLVTDRMFPKRDGTPNQTVYLTDRQGYLQLRGSGTGMVLNETREDNQYVFTESILQFHLRDGNYRLRTVERGGERYLRLSYPAKASESDGKTGSYTVMALVTRTGFIRRFAVTFTDAQDNRLSVRFRYTAIDTTTVSQPEWVSQLRATANDDPATHSTTRDRGTPPERDGTVDQSFGPRPI